MFEFKKYINTQIMYMQNHKTYTKHMYNFKLNLQYVHKKRPNGLLLF